MRNVTITDIKHQFSSKLPLPFSVYYCNSFKSQTKVALKCNFVRHKMTFSCEKCRIQIEIY